MVRPIASSLALLVTLAATPALSATFTVDTTADTTDVSPGDGFCGTPVGPCSLRAAVQETNALAGADDIILPAGTYLLTLTGPAEDAGASGDLDVHDSLTITGAGAASTIIDADGIARVIEAGVNSPSPMRTLTISGVTIRGGHVQSNEGCDGIIQLSGGDGICANTMALVMSDAVVEQNTGQGLLVFGSLSLTRVSVRSNTDLGVFVIFGASTIAETTISGNAGGGLTLDPSASNAVRNSTLSGNGSTGLNVGGGCEPPQIPCPSSGGTTLDNVTITGHSGVAVNDRFTVFPSGGSFAIPVTARNSVLAGNGSECDSELVSGGYNLLQTLTGCTVTGDTTGNVVGAPAVLGPLASNGGPTQTHALLAGSPAINAGNPAAPGSGGGACLATDQRAVARPGGPRCDMGAFESSCGDGVVDANEICDGGACCTACAPSDAACGPCLVCSAGTACVVPSDTCAAPAPTKSSVTIADKVDPTKDGAQWKWTGTSPATKGDYGSPTTSGGTGYALCLYDGAGGSFLLLDAPAGCDQNACWEERSSAFKLTSGPNSQGKFKATLKAGTPGKLRLRTKGTVFGVPGLPLSLPVRVRLSRTDTGACWDADYSADVRKNTAESFRAKSN
jgi:CSLREA domain-containing protein